MAANLAGEEEAGDGAISRLGSLSLLVPAASLRRLETDTPLSVSEETWDAMTGVKLRRSR